MNPNRYIVKVIGPKNISTFLMKLNSAGVIVTALRMDKDAAFFKTDKKGLRQVRKYRRRYSLKITVRLAVNDRGLESLFKSYRFFIVMMIPFVCSFFLWSVTVDSQTPEVAERIEGKLRENGIIKFQPLLFIPDEGEMRRQLMHEDPSLSWVRFKRVGTSLTVIPMLSPVLSDETESDGPPSDLVARTGGMITRFALTKGERVAHVYKTVKKGDILASGTLEQGEKHVVVGAAGAVFAEYWMEYQFVIPKTIQYKVQGEEKVEFVFKPPWQNNKLFSEESLKLIESKRTIHEEYAQLEIDEGMEEAVIIPLLKQKLLGELEAGAIIKEDKVLQVTFDDDKVKGTILFLINDNIAVKRPISQGD